MELFFSLNSGFSHPLKFTTEFVVPTDMREHPGTWIEHLGRYIFALQFCAGKKVLDVACGTGYGLSLISTIASDGSGSDLSEGALEYAKLLPYACPVKFYKGDIQETLDFEQAFDVIVSFETIEHLEKPEAFLSQVKELLSVDGVFVFSIPILCQTAFHKKIYDVAGAKELMEGYFFGIEWFKQQTNNFCILEAQPDENCNYLLGVWRKP